MSPLPSLGNLLFLEVIVVLPPPGIGYHALLPNEDPFPRPLLPLLLPEVVPPFFGVPQIVCSLLRLKLLCWLDEQQPTRYDFLRSPLLPDDLVLLLSHRFGLLVMVDLEAPPTVFTILELIPLKSLLPPCYPTTMTPTPK